ncbi:Uncharacterised protein [Cedecea neteri]|uniref:Uncharacterized protein n=1 Tax=Cedecea neteri TaxID=158822 RepID=A0A2X3KZ49_9ENTR|nr:Uncharacterised protein [Cedecea neteri]
MVTAPQTRSGRNTQQPRVGQRVSGQGLKYGACERQAAAADHRQQRSGQA